MSNTFAQTSLIIRATFLSLPFCTSLDGFVFRFHIFSSLDGYYTRFHKFTQP